MANPSSHAIFKAGRRTWFALMGLWLAACVSSAKVAAPALDRDGLGAHSTLQHLHERLDAILAIDNHCHLLQQGPGFHPEADSQLPLGLRSTNAAFWIAASERFGVALQGDLQLRAAEASKRSEARKAELGAEAYLAEHLHASGLEQAIVNQASPVDTRMKGLRWAPVVSVLLYPIPADKFSLRDPSVAEYVAEQQEQLKRELTQSADSRLPRHLDAYLSFVDITLRRWRGQGAVALKVAEAYVRTLRLSSIDAPEAALLYERGLAHALEREEYERLQDFMLRHVFRTAAQLALPVHIHAAAGRPPFMRLEDAKVLNLEALLSDPTYFETQFVLLHAGYPDVEEAAYLAQKAHVWLDLSALPFLLSNLELVQAVRTTLLLAPGRTLFGTDANPGPGVPVGAELHQVVLARALRSALYQALAGLVEEGMLDLESAVRLGKDVLRDNAKRLYGLH